MPTDATSLSGSSCKVESRKRKKRKKNIIRSEMKASEQQNGPLSGAGHSADRKNLGPKRPTRPRRLVESTSKVRLLEVSCLRGGCEETPTLPPFTWASRPPTRPRQLTHHLSLMAVVPIWPCIGPSAPGMICYFQDLRPVLTSRDELLRGVTSIRNHMAASDATPVSSPVAMHGLQKARLRNPTTRPSFSS